MFHIQTKLRLLYHDLKFLHKNRSRLKSRLLGVRLDTLELSLGIFILSWAVARGSFRQWKRQRSSPRRWRRFPNQPVDRSPPRVPRLLQLPGDPLGPLAVGAVVADEEVFHRTPLAKHYNEFGIKRIRSKTCTELVGSLGFRRVTVLESPTRWGCSAANPNHLGPPAR